MKSDRWRCSFVGVLVVAVFSLVSAAACPKPVSPRPTPAPDLITSVESAMRAGFVDHDLDGYMSAWSKSATLTWSRRFTADPKTDVVLDYAAIRATKKLRWRPAKSRIAKFSFLDPKVTPKGEHVVLTAVSLVESADGSYTERTGEVYEVVLREGRWQIVANRFWVVSSTSGGHEDPHDANFFATTDSAVEKARLSDDRSNLLGALVHAVRFKEAAALCKDILHDGGTADDWALCATVFLLVGDAAKAGAAARKALKLNPSVAVPAWAILPS